MKNTMLFPWFIFCYIFLSQELVVHVRGEDTSAETFAECLNRSNVTSEELNRFRNLEQRIKFRKENLNSRKYGCYLACALKQRGAMTGSVINQDTLAEMISEKYDSNLDVRSLIPKAMEICTNILRKMDDECKAVLAFNICISRILRNKILAY